MLFDENDDEVCDLLIECGNKLRIKILMLGNVVKRKKSLTCIIIMVAN